jgi:hypothetical protein
MVICEPLRPWLLAPFAAAMLAGAAGAAIDDLRRRARWPLTRARRVSG